MAGTSVLQLIGDGGTVEVVVTGAVCGTVVEVVVSGARVVSAVVEVVLAGTVVVAVVGEVVSALVLGESVVSGGRVVSTRASWDVPVLANGSGVGASLRFTAKNTATDAPSRTRASPVKGPRARCRRVKVLVTDWDRPKLGRCVHEPGPCVQVQCSESSTTCQTARPAHMPRSTHGGGRRWLLPEATAVTAIVHGPVCEKVIALPAVLISRTREPLMRICWRLVAPIRRL